MPESTRCITCDVEIPTARLEALPGVQTCVNHSDAQPVVADFECAGVKGTGAGIVIMSPGERKARDRHNKRGFKRQYDFRGAKGRPAGR